MEKPQYLYKLYSKDFQGFLDELYDANGLADMDADWLRERGISCRESGRFRSAAYCFEAALQVENEPEMRLSLLNLLVSTYMKTGEIKVATKITDFMQNVGFDPKRLYSVLPERGF